MPRVCCSPHATASSGSKHCYAHENSNGTAFYLIYFSFFVSNSNLQHSIMKTRKWKLAMQLRPKDIRRSLDIRQDTSAWLAHVSSCVESMHRISTCSSPQMTWFWGSLEYRLGIWNKTKILSVVKQKKKHLVGFKCFVQLCSIWPGIIVLLIGPGCFSQIKSNIRMANEDLLIMNSFKGESCDDSEVVKLHICFVTVMTKVMCAKFSVQFHYHHVSNLKPEGNSSRLFSKISQQHSACLYNYTCLTEW